jgi:hypothetical protein
MVLGRSILIVESETAARCVASPHRVEETNPARLLPFGIPQAG